MTTLARVILVVAAVTFLFFGLAFLFAPVTMAALVDLQPQSATARSDVRAVYGGLEIGVGLLLVYAALRRDRVRDGLVVAVVLFALLAGGRLVGIVVDGPVSDVTLRLVASEIIAALICGAGLALHRAR